MLPCSMKSLSVTATLACASGCPGWDLPILSEDTRRFLADARASMRWRGTQHVHLETQAKCPAPSWFARFDPRHRNSSIGYWIDGASEGRGIMTRACRAMVSEGFHHYGLHRIEIRCATGNNRSASIPRRLGFY